MKKNIYFIMIFIAVFLIGCGESNEPTNQTSSPTDTQVISPTFDENENDKENAFVESEAPTNELVPTQTPTTEQSAVPTQSPTNEVEKTAIPTAMETIKPTEAQKETSTPSPTQTAKPTQAPKPTQTAKPTPAKHTHNYSANETSPTCEALGYTTYTCLGCGHTYKDDYAAAKGHTYRATVIEATCKEGGHTQYKCRDCGKSYVDDYTTVSDHDWGSWEVTKEPTYSYEGSKKSVCKRCGESKNEKIEVLVMPNMKKQNEVLDLVNKEREKEGLSPLKYFYDAQEAADTRAAEIMNVFDHNRPDGSDFSTALDSLGIQYCLAGENIAYGYQTPQDVVDSWMDSEHHRENILMAEYTYLVVGINGDNWVQLFFTLWE